ncbi:MAG: hypothetical protein CMJ31_13045 [Phycisphaerae bacterium]|nr:hypothetical protein [Phycisphaerae bacterium]|tara:strand:- start:558 stop:1316 length:759 start_codon:yes stop_codon:yes gene_type:complete
MRCAVSASAFALTTGVAFGAASPLYTITAISGGQRATYSITMDDIITNMGDNGVLSWSLDGPIDLMSSNGTRLGTLADSAFVFQESDTQARGGAPTSSSSLALDFSIQAGSTLTDFVISAGNTLDSVLMQAVYEATAAVTVTDTQAAGGSATLTGTGATAPNVYNFGFNGFTVGGLVPGPFQTGLSTSASDAVGLTALGGNASSMFANFTFSLSANDTASGTSLLTINGVVPAPASAALLGLGGLVATRRRR